LRPPLILARYELKLASGIVSVDYAAAGLAELERIPPATPPASSKLANIEQPAAFG
jgi:hypothetical protein